MSIVDYDKLSDSINDYNKIFDYAKKIIKNRLSLIYNDEKGLSIINQKLEHIKIMVLTPEEFKKRNPSQFAGAFYDNGVIYLKYLELAPNVFHKLIHEMLHAISDNNKDRHGVMKYWKEENKNYYYGYGINEAVTEYLTALILEEKFYGYSNDFNLVLQSIMSIAKISNSELIEIYLGQKELLNDDLCQRYNRNDKGALKEITIEFDQRLPQTRKAPFKADNVMSNLIISIQSHIGKNEDINFEELKKLIIRLQDHYMEYYDFSDETTNKINNFLFK